MRWWQAAALVLFPSACAVTMDILTGPLRSRVHDEAGRLIADLMSDDPATFARTIAALAHGGALSANHVLDWLFRAVVVLGVAVCVWRLPPAGELRSARSVLACVVCGYVIARFLVGFRWLDWTEMGLCLLAGASVGLLGFLARRHVPGRGLRSRES